MSFKSADRVQETTTTTGTGTVSLAGAVTAYQTFSAGIGNGNSCYYCITDNGSNWEVGIGTYTSSGSTLSRTTVLSSSNANALVNFPAGTKYVFNTYPAESVVYGYDGSNLKTLDSQNRSAYQTDGATIAFSWGTSFQTTQVPSSVNDVTNKSYVDGKNVDQSFLLASQVFSSRASAGLKIPTGILRFAGVVASLYTPTANTDAANTDGNGSFNVNDVIVCLGGNYFVCFRSTPTNALWNRLSNGSVTISSSRDPGSTDDQINTSGIGTAFAVGNIWKNFISNAVFYCLNPSTSNAIWAKLYPAPVNSFDLTNKSYVDGLTGSSDQNILANQVFN